MRGGGGVKKLTLFSDRWDWSGQLGRATGSIKDHFEHDVGQDFEVSLTLVGSIPNRFVSSLGPAWATFVRFALQKCIPLFVFKPSPGNYFTVFV